MDDLRAPESEAKRSAAGGAPAAVEIRDLNLVFDATDAPVRALAEVNLTVNKGDFVSLIGPSGCGKTTLLHLLAGLDTPTAGQVEMNGTRCSLMFQEAALFPWLTAAGNIDLALRLRDVPRAERRSQTAGLLEMVRLADFARRRPHELSGGMRQRVALARALAQDADVVLMDEPFGALDAITRDLLHDELERIWRERGLTVLFVTHNAREAVRLGDRVVVLTSRPGRVASEVAVGIPRPRRTGSPELAALAAEIGERLRKEVYAHGG